MASSLSPIVAPAGIQAGTPFVGSATGGDVLFVKQTNPAIAVSTPLVHINVSTTPPQIQIGPFSSALGASQIPGATVIGSGAAGTAGGNGNIVVIGTNATTASTQDDVIIGHTATGGSVNVGNGSVAIGVGSVVGGVGSNAGGGVAIGNGAAANNGVALGQSATCVTGQVAIGLAATATTFGVAVGGGATASVGAGHGNGAVAVGRNASAGESTDIVVATGGGGTASGQGGNIYIGGGTGGTGVTAANCIVIGGSSNTGGGSAPASASANFCTILGGNSTSANAGCRVFGRGVSSTATNQTIIGGTDDPCANVFLGNGVTAASPQNVVVGVTGGSGLNVAGASQTIAGGIATGNAAGGSLVFRTSVVAASSSTPQALATALTIDNTQSLLIAQKITQYLGVSTVDAGVPSLVAHANLTAQAAAITATTIYAVPAGGAGVYRISWAAIVTQAASTSSTLGGATTGFQVVYTDNDTGASATTPLAAAPAAGTNTAYSQTNSDNAVGAQASGTILVNAKASTNLQYQFGYTSVGATVMQFALHVKVEYLG